MDPQQMAQLQQLQGMYGAGMGGPPRIGTGTGGFQPQPFQVQNRPLPAAGGGAGQAAPGGAPPGAGGGGGQQQGGQGGGGWAQTLMPLMKGMQGMMQRPQQPGAQPGGGMAGPPIVQNQGQMGPFMNQMAPPGGINPGAVTNGIVNSWPYPR
jgi:hypothetical protein